jgi:SnoaL-like domain
VDGRGQVAFNAQDSEAAARLFTADGTYPWGPFGETLVGPDAIRRAWDEHQNPDEVAEMTYEVQSVAVRLFREWWDSREEAL